MKWLMRMLGKTKKDRHGFTLIELMIVLIIVAILAVAAVPTYTYFVKRAYESEASASLGAIKTAQLVYWAEKDTYTNDWANLGMTSADFSQNKWFGHDTMLLATADSTSFTAFCDGSKDDGAAEVKKIKLKITAKGDIVRVTETSGTECPDT